MSSPDATIPKEPNREMLPVLNHKRAPSNIAVVNSCDRHGSTMADVDISESGAQGNAASLRLKHSDALLHQEKNRRAHFDADLQSIDLTPVRYVLARQGWELEKILTAELAFLRFMQAVRREPAKPRAPTRQADDYWHAFILITPLYIETCDHLFGRYLHHWPFGHAAGSEPADSPVQPEF